MMNMRITAAALLIASMCIGCASRKKPMNEWAASERYAHYVPEKAPTVAEGTGVIRFTAPEDGTVYVLDLTDQVRIKDATFPRALGSWLARQDEIIEFDPATARFGPAGNEGVRIKKVNPAHTHQFRFDPSNKDR